jgi:hypothetical protein
MILRGVFDLYELVTSPWGPPTTSGARQIAFADADAARALLQGVAGLGLPALREGVARELSGTTARSDDAHVLAQAAHWLDIGHWSLYRIPMDRTGGGKGPEAATERPAPPPEARVPEIVSCRWSKSRAWQTDEVSMRITTANVPPETRMEISIWESDRDEGSPDDKIQTVKATTQGDRSEVFFAFNLTPEQMARESRLEGRTQEFYFLVSIPSLSLKERSDLIYVPIPTYVYG